MENLGIGTLLWYKDRSGEYITAIEGEDNKNFYSVAALCEGNIGSPINLTHMDMWFTKSHRYPEVKGFVTFANISIEALSEKMLELEDDFEKWLWDTTIGKISSDRSSIEIYTLSPTFNEIRSALSFFSGLNKIKPETEVTVNMISRGSANMIYKNSSKVDAMHRLATFVILGQESDEVISLINQYKAGDQSAAEQLLTKYSKLIKGMIRSFIRSGLVPRGDEEDVQQEAEAKLFTLLESYDPQKTNFSTYLHRGVKNLILTLYKERGAKEVEDKSLTNFTHIKHAPTTQLNPEEHALQQEENTVLTELMNALPSNLKDVVHKYYFEGKTLKEIATEVGVSLQRVHQMLEEAVEQLQMNSNKKRMKIETMKLGMIFGALYDKE